MSAMNLSLQQAQSWLTGARCVGDARVVVDRVHTDTRTLRAGDLFVALRGEKFDANQFIDQAKAQGAVAVLCAWCLMHVWPWVSWPAAGVLSLICP